MLDIRRRGTNRPDTVSKPEYLPCRYLQGCV